jgi:hypothetical protein
MEFVRGHPGCAADLVAEHFGIEPELAAEIVNELLAEGRLELA